MAHQFVSTALIALLVGVTGAAQAGEAREGKGSTNLSRTDRNFIEKAMKDNHAEIALAKVAQERASSDQVKKYAQKLHDDHSKAAKELEAIASKVGYTPKKADKEPREVKKFSKMSGEKFDREFAKHMVDDHEKAVKLFRKQAQDGEAQELWQFAQNTLPKLEEHLRMAQELSGEKRKERKARKDS